MTNNQSPHCPAEPAQIQHRPEHDIKIAQRARDIMDRITEFAEELSMDEMLILDPRIADSWNECPRCESLVCETQGKAYGYVVQGIMQYLHSELC